MTDGQFTTSFVVDRTPGEAFAAINDVRGWWTGDIDGATCKVGDEFTYRSADVHRSRQRVTESIPGQRVVWHVVEGYLNFARDTSEWTGTDIIFEISMKDDKTEVCFTHAGLVPAFECFDSCSSAWGYYINGNLRSLMTSGQLNPSGNGKEAVG